MSDRPVLRCLIYKFTPWPEPLTYKFILLSEWGMKREDLMAQGWRFIGVDPSDEFSLATWEQDQRSKHWRAK